MEWNTIDIGKFETDITLEFQLDTDERILAIHVSGHCRSGSQGSIDSDVIFSSMASYFFWLEPQALVLNLTQLHYEYGNSLLKVLDFFSVVGRDEYEKNLPMAIVVSDKNEVGITSLLELSTKDYSLFSKFEEGVNYITAHLEEY